MDHHSPKTSSNHSKSKTPAGGYFQPVPSTTTPVGKKWLGAAGMLPDTESMKSILAVCGLSLLCSGISSFAQSSSGSSGMVRGSVLDPVRRGDRGRERPDIRNPVSGTSRSGVTDSQGKFQFDNLPFNPYHVSSRGCRSSSRLNRTSM